MSSAVPTRVLAGVSVPDTPVVNAAIAFAREHLDEVSFNHVMRSTLLGLILASKQHAEADYDTEVHSVAAILHDLGWDQTGRLVSPDRRFEIDGAIAAREFLAREAPGWDPRRVQLVWDAIALHTTPSIYVYKETEVATCGMGIVADFAGPDNLRAGALTWEEYDRVVAAFPRTGMVDGVLKILCGICATKPATTYDNFVASIGEALVPGYSTKGTGYGAAGPAFPSVLISSQVLRPDAVHQTRARPSRQWCARQRRNLSGSTVVCAPAFLGPLSACQAVFHGEGPRREWAAQSLHATRSYLGPIRVAPP